MEAGIPIKKINGYAFLIGCVSFLMSFSSAIVISCAMDFSKHLGAGASIVILGRMIGEGSGYLGRFIVGFISDIVGNRRNFLLLGYGAIIVIKPLFIISCVDVIPEIYRVFIYTTANISEKFFGSVRDPIRDAWLAEHTSKEDLSINLTFRRFLSYSGTILGAIFSFVLVGKISYQKLFSLALFPAFFGVLMLWKFIHDSPKLKRIPQQVEKTLIGVFFSEIKTKKKSLFLIMLFLAVFCLFFGKINEFSLWFAAEKAGISESNPILFIIFYLSSCVGTLLLSFFLQRFSMYLILSGTAIIIICINFLVPICLSYWLMIVATIYYGIYGAFIDILTTIITIKHFHDSKWKATVVSLLNFTIGISYGFSGFINKLLIEKYGLITPFKLSLIPLFIGVIIVLGIYFFVDKNEQNS